MVALYINAEEVGVWSHVLDRECGLELGDDVSEKSS
jgi:hypothetical protein